MHETELLILLAFLILLYWYHTKPLKIKDIKPEKTYYITKLTDDSFQVSRLPSIKGLINQLKKSHSFSKGLKIKIKKQD